MILSYDHNGYVHNATEIHSRCMLRTPFDIVLNTFPNIVITLGVFCNTNSFYKCGHRLAPKRSPDMIVSAFQVNLHSKLICISRTTGDLPGLNKHKTKFKKRHNQQLIQLTDPEIQQAAYKFNAGGLRARQPLRKIMLVFK